MPYKNPEDRARWMREYRRRKNGQPAQEPDPHDWTDPAGALEHWSRTRLVVPPGHPRSGQPMVLPPYAVAFLREALADGVRDALLSTGRKNAKSAICAALVLGMMAEGAPLRRPGLRIGTVSVTREKAGELLRQCRAIAEASGLAGLQFRRSPAPGWIVGAGDASAEFLSADKSSGHASGFDLALVDELGLMGEADRELVAGMRTATSARDGRLVAISIRGDSPLLEEMIERRKLPSTVVHLHAPDVPEGAAVDIHDPEVWAAGNPGIAAGIKSADWMRDEARRVEVSGNDMSSFLALDLNLPQAARRDMIFTPADYTACCVEDLAPREGPVVLGLDVGEATSGTAAAAIWPLSGPPARVETWLAFGDTPSLRDRARADGSPYEDMERRGELRTFPGRIVPVPDFLNAVLEDLDGAEVLSLSADSYKQAEVMTWAETAAVPWPLDFRRRGAGPDGGKDIRALQRLVVTQRIAWRPTVALVSALRWAVLHHDKNGNPGLDKSRTRGRIDLVSALLMAAGPAEDLIAQGATPAFEWR